MRDFSGWVPMRIFWRDSRPMVDWGYLGTRRFTEPFFGQTVQPCLWRPADMLFRPQTPLNELGEIAAAQSSARLAGFIFHMSRCGSTLTSQMLAALPANIVLSEPEPVDNILRSRFNDPRITEEQQVQWLRWLVSVLSWRRSSAEQNVFIKFDCWHVLFLPLIERAFPDVPWIFQYREPVEVMASAQKMPGQQMVPGMLPPALFGWDLATVVQMPIPEYTARVLLKLCEAALVQAQAGRGKLLNYQQMPMAVWPALMAYWRGNFSDAENQLMRAAARTNAKNPGQPFMPDSQAKRESVSPALRDLTHEYLDDVYQQLEARRRIQGFA